MASIYDDSRFFVWLDRALEDQECSLDAESTVLLRLLGRELRSPKPQVRLGAVRLLGQLLGKVGVVATGSSRRKRKAEKMADELGSFLDRVSSEETEVIEEPKARGVEWTRREKKE